MILDASAVVAILRDEPEADAFTNAIASSKCHISAVNYVEASVVFESSKDPIVTRRFDDFFHSAPISIEAVTPEQAKIARAAYRDFGKGRHKAGLNLGDCFAYALAKDMDEPLLYKGNDFSKTDIESAVK